MFAVGTKVQGGDRSFVALKVTLQNGVLRGAGHGGSGGPRVPAGGETGEKKGMRCDGGPCGARNRPPGAAAPPGHYNNGVLM